MLAWKLKIIEKFKIISEICTQDWNEYVNFAQNGSRYKPFISPQINNSKYSIMLNCTSCII